MTRYALLVDTTKCIGCGVCVAICKDQFVDNDWPPYSAAQPTTGQFWIQLTEFETGKAVDYTYQHKYVSQLCMLCDNPPCVAAGKNGAIFKRPDGIVIIDPVASKGQQQIVAACPYGRIFWNDALQIPQKCTLCAHRLDKGLTPACVNACPTNVFTIGDDTQLASKVSAANAKVLSPGLGAVPKVYYAGLPASAPTT
jgi:Fe-S-cluster-containing dehydrogenase component